MRYQILLLTMIISIIFGGRESMGKGKTKTLPPGQHNMEYKASVTVKMKLPYLLYLPKEYNSEQKEWPLILFLHGMGERGNDLEKVKVHGPPKIVDSGKDMPFIIVSPQCPEDGMWMGLFEIEALKGLLDEIIKKYSVDKNRVYLTGLSMGGYGTWSLAIKYPEYFAAVVPICGGGEPESVHRLKNVPVWVFHGKDDKTVPLKRSQEMVNALKACGGDVKFTVYPDTGHDSWTKTYDNPRLYKWFLKHSKKTD